MVVWFAKVSVFHSVNSDLSDQILLVVPYLYGLYCSAIYMDALDCDMILEEVSEKWTMRIHDHV